VEPRRRAEQDRLVSLNGTTLGYSVRLDTDHAPSQTVDAELPRAPPEILAYARAGGTVIVQYNKYEYPRGNFAPYPLTIASPHDRVTDEDAQVTLLRPDHAVLSRPNRIGEADFTGWVQERGLYFANTWDERYEPLLEMHDPGEDPLRGSLLVAKYGQGTYVYTGIAFFRQLPEGVPGVWRLLANLVSLGARTAGPVSDAAPAAPVQGIPGPGR
jgi:hypothetical protein